MKESFVDKQYYTTFLDTKDKGAIIQHLAERGQIDSPELADIRFAQGEVYFHVGDYETAIFKWGKVQNELAGWATKNIADTLFLLGRLPEAEAMYTGIQTTDDELTMEVTLCLFSLYHQTGKFDLADTMLKRGIAFRPDYPDLTNIARDFYEEQENWICAIDLAKDELLRTKSGNWLTTLESYVTSKVAENHSPNYFYQPILVAYTLGSKPFEQFVAALWSQYEQADLYLEWLGIVGNVLLETVTEPQALPTISTLFKASYQRLTSGQYSLQTVQQIIPNFFTNWLKVTTEVDCSFAVTAILTWNELFPMITPPHVVAHAEEIPVEKEDILDYLTKLLKDIINWTAKKELALPVTLKDKGFQILSSTTAPEQKNSQLQETIREMLVVIWEAYKGYEKQLQDSIHWNQDIVGRLNGFVANLKELEQEKIQAMLQSYQEMKEKLRKNIEENVPVILKNCREFITEDSDFSQVHLELNDEMNKRVYEYLHQLITVEFTQNAHIWVNDAHKEFIQVQAYLEEMSQTLNAQFQEDLLQLKLDYHVLDDWHRDMDRITNRVKLDELNIFLRFTPSQALLKGVGKIINPLVQNKSMLLTRYRKYVKTKNYDDVVEIVLNEVFHPFELFESALDRDVSMLFAHIFQRLQTVINSGEQEISENQKLLGELTSTSELYSDPLILFDVRLQQYEKLG